MNNQTKETTNEIGKETLGEVNKDLAGVELSTNVLDITPLDEKKIEASVAGEDTNPAISL